MNLTPAHKRALMLFALADELQRQIVRAHERGQVDAHKATWLIHFVVDVDAMRSEATRLWNTPK